MAGLGGNFFLADDMYILPLFLFLLVIVHTFFLGYITAGGDFGSTMSHRDAAWAWQHLFHFFDLTVYEPVVGAVSAAVVVVISYRFQGHLRA